MKVVIQRVNSSSVQIDQKIKSEVERGLLVLVGICEDDKKNDVEWLVNKILNLRIFNDKDGIMNDSLIDIKGEILIISQFTLMALTKKVKNMRFVFGVLPGANKLIPVSVAKLQLLCLPLPLMPAKGFSWNSTTSL